MHHIDKYYFDRFLKDNGSYENYYKEIGDMCFVFPYSARGSIKYQDFLFLPKSGPTGKYFMVLIEILFRDSQRDYRILSIEELHIDEYLSYMMEENEIREVVTEIFKLLR